MKGQGLPADGILMSVHGNVYASMQRQRRFS
jgi:hypothetical protein